MPKILFILGMYKPRSSANGICVERVVDALCLAGYSVDCIANAELKSPSVSIDHGVNIYRVKPRLVYRLDEWVEYNQLSWLCKPLKLISRFIGRTQLLISILRWPIISRSYSNRFSRLAKQLHKTEHYNAVIGVYAPIDTAIAACNLKNYDKNITCILYFLDSLSGGYGLKLLPLKYSMQRSLKYEKYLMNVADKSVIMKSSAEHHKKYNPELIYKIVQLDIPLLFDSKWCPSNRGLKNETIHFAYVGSISCSTRDPSFLIRVLIAASCYPIEITFVGSIDCMSLFSPLIEAYGSRIHFLGRTDHETALDIMKSVNVLLNIGNSNPLMVPSKIFEYLSMRKPIITTYSIKNEPSLGYLNRYPLALAIEEKRTDYDQIAAEIVEFVSNTYRKCIDYSQLETLFPLNTTSAFVNVIRNILFEKSSRREDCIQSKNNIAQPSPEDFPTNCFVRDIKTIGSNSAVQTSIRLGIAGSKIRQKIDNRVKELNK